MIGADVYPITLAEMPAYSADVVNLFTDDEHEKMKAFLAVHPDFGELIAGTNGIRQLLWPVGAKKQTQFQIVYYFRDLNMPVYLLAIYAPGDHVGFDEEFRRELAQIVDVLVEEHSKRWLEQFASRLPPTA